MSDSSLILSLPYIQPAQAQKHVTHNEAIRALDVIVQPTVIEVGRDTPPATPAQGARYVVGPAPTDAWAGHAGAIAVWEDSGWSFVAPAIGWSTRATDTLSEWVYDGSAWVLPGGAQETLGINTTADTTNRLAVSAPSTLLTHEGAGHQLKINKASAAETASLLFQSDWAGRAEMGLAGTDEFSIKLSADGSAWFTGVQFDAATGQARFPSGARVPRRAEITGRWSAEADHRWVTLSRTLGLAGDTHASSGGTGAEPALDWRDMGLFLPQGGTVEGLEGALRADGAEAADVSSVSLRLYFQYGPATDWDSDVETTRDLLLSLDDAPLGAGWQTLAASVAPYTAPQDGHLVLYLKPGGTYAATQHILSTLAVRYTQ